MSERTIVIDVPARVLIHLDPATRKATRMTLLPSESDAGYFGPGTQLAYVLEDGEQAEATEDEKRMALSVWDDDWDWGILPAGPEIQAIEWVV